MINHIADLLNGTLDVNVIVNEAEQQYRFLVSKQVLSFKNMQASFDIYELYSEWYASESELTKTFLKALVAAGKKKLMFSELELSDDAKYKKCRLRERLPAVHVENYGITLTYIGDDAQIEVPTLDVLKKVVE
jgi:hypothetical protein